MRLIVTHPDNPLLPTTWSRAPMNLLNELRALGHEVHPFACGRGSSAERLLFRTVQKIRGSDVTYSPLFRLYAKSLLDKEIRRLRPDAVIHCATTAAIPHRQSTTRHYLYCDSTWHRYVTLSPDFAPPPSKIIAQVDALERAAYSSLNYIFAFSTATRNNLIDYYGVSPARVSIVGTGSGNVTPYFGPKCYKNGVILYVALRAPRQKGGELLLKAFQIAVARNPALSLVMEGGSVPPEMAVGIPQVTLRGKSNSEELQQLFNSASLYAMPALFEPWGNVYIEALASRTPILGLNRHSLPDISGQGRFGFLVDDASPEAVSQAILDATSDPDRLEVMGLAGQNYVLENYTWGKVAQIMISRISADALV